MDSWIDIEYAADWPGRLVIGYMTNGLGFARYSQPGNANGLIIGALKKEGYRKVLYIPKPETLMPTLKEAIELGLVEDDGSIPNLGLM